MAKLTKWLVRCLRALARKFLGKVPPRPAPAPAPSPEPRAEPVVEGFFVARVFGEDEARSHHLTGQPLPPAPQTHWPPHHEDSSRQLPEVYQDDRVVLLARDPHSAWVYWDFHPDTVRAALEQLPSPRVVLQVFEDGAVQSTLDAALETRGFYLHGLAAAKTFRVEVHAVGANGVSVRIGPASNPVLLPADAPSGDHSVRFLRVPWGVPLRNLRAPLSAPSSTEPPPMPAQVLTVVHAQWVPGANSGSWQLQFRNETSGWMPGGSSRTSSPGRGS